LSFSGGTNRTVDRFILTPGILRGFEPGGIGPRDATAGDTLGGNLYVAARFEAEFPVGLPEEYGISGALFYDVGNLWGLKGVTGDTSTSSVDGKSGSLRHVIGFGVLWKTPVGPLRFNFTKTLQLEDYDRKQNFNFTLSTIF
jgi:outer membrane protein insertion porin family